LYNVTAALYCCAAATAAAAAAAADRWASNTCRRATCFPSASQASLQSHKSTGALQVGPVNACCDSYSISPCTMLIKSAGRVTHDNAGCDVSGGAGKQWPHC
jgi:hypothetical protein